MKSSFDKLKDRIKKDLDMDLEDFKRLYPGYWQRAAGAFVWCAQYVNAGESYGSIYPVKRLLESKKPLEIDRTGCIHPGE